MEISSHQDKNNNNQPITNNTTTKRLKSTTHNNNNLLTELRRLSQESSRFDQVLFDKLEDGLYLETIRGGRTQLDGLVQRARNWLRCRRDRITASLFGILSEQSTMYDAYSAWEFRRLGQYEKDKWQNHSNNIDIDRGVKYELTATRAYEAAVCGHQVISCGFYLHRQYDWLGASPDGLLQHGNGLIEVKCPRKLRDHVPSDHIAQIQGQLEIMDRDFCDYVQWHIQEGIRVHRIFRSKPYWEWLFIFLQRFQDCIIQDKPPRRRSTYSKEELTPPMVKIVCVR
jgi:hypothetical protein